MATGIMKGLWTERRRFWRSVPAGSYVVFLSGVFLMFGSIGLLGDISGRGSSPPLRLLASMLFSGALAVAYVVVIQRSRWLPLLVAIHIVLSIEFDRFVPAEGPSLTGEALHGRLQLDVDVIATGLILSFILLSNFATREGYRYARVHTEIALARDIHRLLVRPIATRKNIFEFRGLSIASGDVGGDLIDVVESDNGWTGYVADVSGHGVGAGLLMGMVKSAARTELHTSPTMDQLLNTLNRVLADLRKPGMFVTYAGLQFTGSSELVFSVAGHLPILHYRASCGTIDELSIPQVPLAMFDDRSFSSSRVRSAPGDLFVILTDGFTEVFDRHDQEFGLDRVKAIIREHALQPLEQIERALLTAVHDHGQPHDDQTLLLVRQDIASDPRRA